MVEELPLLHKQAKIQETTVGEINIAGLPGVNVPAGYYRSGSPFSLEISSGNCGAKPICWHMPSPMSARPGIAGPPLDA